MKRSRFEAVTVMGRLLAVTLFVVACGRTDDGSGEPDGAGVPRGGDEIAFPVSTSDSIGIPERAILFTGMLRETPSSRDRARQVYGEPDSATSQTVPNRHLPGATDTLIALHYPGLVVRFHIPGPGGELLSQVDVSDNRYLQYGLIGAPIRLVEQEIGPADESGDSTSLYFCRACVAGDDPVTLFTREGRIVRVRFAYYVD